MTAAKWHPIFMASFYYSSSSSSRARSSASVSGSFSASACHMCPGAARVVCGYSATSPYRRAGSPRQHGAFPFRARSRPRSTPCTTIAELPATQNSRDALAPAKHGSGTALLQPTQNWPAHGGNRKLRVNQKTTKPIRKSARNAGAGQLRKK